MTTKKYNYSTNNGLVVPAGVTSIYCELWAGAAPYYDGLGNWTSPSTGLPYFKVGNFIAGNLAVTPGDFLVIIVGGDGTKTGTTHPVSPPAGDGNGGFGGQPTVGVARVGGCGAGATGINKNSSALGNELVIAAAPGGAGVTNSNIGSYANNGSFGGQPGVTGPNYTDSTAPQNAYRSTDSSSGSGVASTGGGNATATANGAGGVSGGTSPNFYTVGAAGNNRNGGNGGIGNIAGQYNDGGGGGGGGYKAGGGGSGLTTNSANGQAAGGGAGAPYLGATFSLVSIARKRMTTADDSAWSGANGFARLTYHIPPNAGTPVSPVGGVSMDVTQAITLDWAYSTTETDALAYSINGSIRWRVGSGSWTVVALANVNGSSITMAANYFAAQVGTVVEWQCLPKDAAGIDALAWSASAFFTPQPHVPDPAITSPATGSTVTGSPSNVVWTNNGNQGAYQVRTVADLAGAPDATTVYYDSGVVTGAATTALIPFPVNGRVEHPQVRYQDATSLLWSNWVSITVTVTYTIPALPTITVTPHSNNLTATLVITNPAPTGGQPALDHQEVWVVEPDGTSKRVAILAPAVTSYTYLYAMPGEEFYVVAVGVNGTQHASATSAAIVLAIHGVWLCNPTNALATLLNMIYNDNGASEVYDVEAVATNYAGREFPVVDFGDGSSNTLTVNITHVDEDGGTQASLRKLVESRTILLYRDIKGRKVFGYIAAHPVTDGWGKGLTQIVMTRVDYNEAV